MILFKKWLIIRGLLLIFSYFKQVSALEQVLHGKPKPLFSMPFTKPGKLLTEIPQSIKNFYDKMLSNPSGAGQNLTLIGETFHADWQSRPNGLNPTGKGIVYIVK